MTDKNTGGSAFPSHGSMGEVAQEGQTLRDYFAAKAMQAFICSPNATQDWIKEYCSSSAYGMADAMLAEREKP